MKESGIPPLYVDESWGHIFSDGKERDVRFVIDTRSLEVVQLQIFYGMTEGGWTEASASALADVRESLDHNEIFNDIRSLREGGDLSEFTLLVEENFRETMPDWPTGIRFFGPRLG